MAEVLPPIVQTTSAIAMLPTSPEAFQSSSALSSHAQRMASVPRSHLYVANNGNTGYRGVSTPAVAPYAFQQTPHLKQEARTMSTPVFRTTNPAPLPSPAVLRPYPASASTSSTSTASSSSSSNPSVRGNHAMSKDDMMLGNRQSAPADKRASAMIASSSTPDLLMRADAVKPSPDRYRRVTRRVESSNSTPTLQTRENNRHSLALPSDKPSKSASLAVQAPPHKRTSSADDSMIVRSEGLNRYRRRSVGAFDHGSIAAPKMSPINTPAPTWATVAAARENIRPNQTTQLPNQSLVRPTSYHSRQDSYESSSSGSSSRKPTPVRQDSTNSFKSAVQPIPAGSPGPQGFSERRSNASNFRNAEPSKRLTLPSPLSQPYTGEPEAPKAAKPQPATTQPEPASPAVQHLSALTEKDPNKGVKSRLRRAFSFGSAQELRKASGETTTPAERAKLRKEQADSRAANDEDAAVAAKQEAAGLGAGIYSGQGVFLASTDNISVSSTASSASMMLRKMGRGVKKSTRSLKGLFRPKSMMGAPAADNAVTSSATPAEVSLITVEAEREKAKANLDKQDRTMGNVVLPKLDNDSMESSRPTTADKPSSSHETRDTWTRKSIIGGDRERAEVLAAVKKGILKRSATDPVSLPSHGGDVEFATGSEGVPSVPGTPDERAWAEGKGEYFLAATRYANSSTKSLPGPGPHGTARSISFSPRIQFYDVWSSQEYDRRGDIATCNRLTPMLAQQIKEELNSFKMEMEVHELSKPHTHFF